MGALGVVGALAALGTLAVTLQFHAGWGLTAEPARAAPATAQGPAAPGPTPTSQGHGQAPTLALLPPGPTTAPAPAAAATGLSALLTAPEAGLRGTLQKAMAAPEHGGRLYARALARRCADLAALPTGDTADLNAPQHQRALARQAALATGCGQLANTEQLALVNVAADDTARDPLLAVQQSDLADAALLQAVRQRPDPLLLDELGERLLERRIHGLPVLYFDGQRYDDEAAQASVQAALRLLPCHFGLPCDERDPQVWLACLRGEGCADSRQALASPAAQALAVRLATALRAGDLARFLPGSVARP